MKGEGQKSRVKGQAGRVVFESRSPEETEAVGTTLGKLLAPGDVVTLSGELGGGKTCFVRGVVSVAAPESIDLVSSPTFAILNIYPGNPSIYHYDCYRLRGEDDASELGIDEQLHGEGICLIEWPERIAAILPENRLSFSFSYLAEQRREITVTASGKRGKELLEKLVKQENCNKKQLSDRCGSVM